MFDCFGVMLSPYFRRKAKISKWPKKPGNRTNMDITLSFLAKSLDKHGITLVHITYPPLEGLYGADFRLFLVSLEKTYGKSNGFESRGC